MAGAPAPAALAYHHIVDPLLERRPLDSILAYFEARDLPLRVHTAPPVPPTREELLRLPREVRHALQADESTHWVDLGEVAHHYGQGRNEEEAIRSAARRFRIEQAPKDDGTG